jgi:hypothetical protein
MTANEMKYEFNVIRDRVLNFDAPSLEDNEISLLLSKAEERFLITHYSGNNKLRESFEETEKRRKDLSNLVKTLETSTPSSNQINKYSTNSVFFDLPVNCLYVIHEHVITSSEIPCYNNLILSIKPVTHDQINLNISNPFKKPDTTMVWRLDYSQNPSNLNRRHELVHGEDYTIGSYFMRYVERLPGIVVDTANPANQINSVLDESVHRRVIDLAVEITLETLQDNRLQTNVLLNNKNE